VAASRRSSDLASCDEDVAPLDERGGFGPPRELGRPEGAAVGGGQCQKPALPGRDEDAISAVPPDRRHALPHVASPPRGWLGPGGEHPEAHPTLPVREGQTLVRRRHAIRGGRIGRQAQALFKGSVGRDREDVHGTGDRCEDQAGASRGLRRRCHQGLRPQVGEPAEPRPCCRDRTTSLLPRRRREEDGLGRQPRQEGAEREPSPPSGGHERTPARSVRVGCRASTDLRRHLSATRYPRYDGRVNKSRRPSGVSGARSFTRSGARSRRLVVCRRARWP
jgi:hypothetical protein